MPTVEENARRMRSHIEKVSVAIEGFCVSAGRCETIPESDHAPVIKRLDYLEGALGTAQEAADSIRAQIQG